MDSALGPVGTARTAAAANALGPAGAAGTTAAANALGPVADPAPSAAPGALDPVGTVTNACSATRASCPVRAQLSTAGVARRCYWLRIVLTIFSHRV